MWESKRKYSLVKEDTRYRVGNMVSEQKRVENIIGIYSGRLQRINRARQRVETQRQEE